MSTWVKVARLHLAHCRIGLVLMGATMAFVGILAAAVLAEALAVALSRAAYLRLAGGSGTVELAIMWGALPCASGPSPRWVGRSARRSKWKPARPWWIAAPTA